MKDISLSCGGKVSQAIKTANQVVLDSSPRCWGQGRSQAQITDIIIIHPPSFLGQVTCQHALGRRGRGGTHGGSASPDGPDHEVHQHRAAHHHQHGQGPLGHGLVARVGAHRQAATHGAFPGFPSKATGL